MLKKVVVLGSTGSVGTQTLQVAKAFPDRIKVIGISAFNNVAEVLKQIKDFIPQTVVLVDDDSALRVKLKLKNWGKKFSKVKVLGGKKGLAELAGEGQADIVFNSLLGSAGIIPTMEAIKKGKVIALSNKETLVAAGRVIMQASQKYQAQIIPVDSEHSAIFQCLLGEKKENLKKIILTCSGGPFRTTSLQNLKKVTVKQALNHPSWKMGGKITIDSSTLMNKGLEVIEAHWLFGVDFQGIQVLIHPQSLVHSLIEFQDGAIKAQIGEPTMAVPIQLAFFYPERLPNKNLPIMKLKRLKEMTFEEPNWKKFPCLQYAYEAGKKEGGYPVVLNASNEIAVEAFLKGKIKYLEIAKIVRKSLEKAENFDKALNLNDILELDQLVKDKLRKELKL